MSLHDAAQHLASQGRHGDSMLVHMNPNEVAGLQALAQHKGTSLTINPDTGMPEAFGLGDLNPFRIVQGKGEIGESGFGSMLIGAALMAAGVPAPMAGYLTGGATLAMGGNLRQAVGQGLGAYGGASMANSAGWAPTQDGSMIPVEDRLATPNAPAAPPAAATAATPVSTMPTQPPAGYFDNTMAAAENTVTPAQAERLAATTAPATQAVTPTVSDKVAEAAAKKNVEQSFMSKYGWPAAGLGALALTQEKPKGVQVEGQHPGFIRPFIYDPQTQGLTQLRPVRAPGYAAGGLPVEQMSNANAVGMNTGYPQADLQGYSYASPWQTPVSENVVQGAADTGINRMTGQMLAAGGLSDLGAYSDGGRLLKGPGDGVSDSIPAVIGNKQPARLADGEFVVPARIVSELGNGSTEAGARKLYGMMDRIQKARSKTTGKNKVAANSRADKYLPA